MNEIEFRKKLYSDPLAGEHNSPAGADLSQEQAEIVAETQEMELQMQTIMQSTEVPADLKGRLLAIPEHELKEETAISDLAQVAERPAANSSYFNVFALAASLVLALGVTFSFIYDAGPSATEIAFGESVLEHLYEEIAAIEAINSGTSVNTVGMPMVRSAMAGVGTSLVSNEFVASMPVHFAKPCNLIPAYDSAHLIIEGAQGAVSFFVINNSPVSVEYRIQDERFNGVVIPVEHGNIIVVGEPSEDLGEYKNLFTESVSWAI
ncbi:MAG: DUF3379 family protein [Pseudohongiellaceae bacterium]